MGGGPDGSGGPHVFVDDLAAPFIAAEDHHHLSRVRRLRVGDDITLGDGRGRWCPATFAEEPEVAGDIVEVEPLLPAITIGMAPVKGDRTATAVQKLTELGVDGIVMLETSRSVVRWDPERGAKAVERLRSVVRSAASQSRQVWLPHLTGPVAVSAMLAVPDVAVAERGGSVPDLSHPTLLVGPEGGWDESEIGRDVTRVSLGSGVLRAETAAIAAGVLLTSLRVGLVSRHAE